ncbi:TlpA family protein disulfide reductase [Flavobacterium sp. WC2509]|uniref:TlpA family protein disulfide reductase n=1 Tax=Flavobacterium sp. WC2509 TaxID=3461406 RepID=UPI004043E77B
MKKIFLMTTLFISSCMIFAQNNNYVTFEAEITNTEGPFFISTQDKMIKKIIKNKDGVYKDTLKVADGSYKFFDGKNYVSILLKSNYNLKLKMDANDVYKTIVFSGTGSGENNFLTQSLIASKKNDLKVIYNYGEVNFKNKIEELKQSEYERVDKYILDPALNSNMKKAADVKYAKITGSYAKKMELATTANNERALKNAELIKMNGKNSPDFKYRNYNGSKTKLESFKGKYVYIDIWATWCGPCMREIPFLQKVEEKYHDKNIVFVSISVDKEDDFDKWLKVVQEKNLGGVQLFADDSWNSDFAKSYGVTSIPRFILIDPNGKIVNAVAPRPSSDELIKDLDALLN